MLSDPEFVEFVCQIARGSGLSPSRFCLEITESNAMEDVEQSRTIVQALRSEGFRVSMDDFGTGFATYSYLKRYEVDEIKIDGTFVAALGAKLTQLRRADASNPCVPGLLHQMESDSQIGNARLNIDRLGLWMQVRLQAGIGHPIALRLQSTPTSIHSRPRFQRGGPAPIYVGLSNEGWARAVNAVSGNSHDLNCFRSRWN